MHELLVSVLGASRDLVRNTGANLKEASGFVEQRVSHFQFKKRKSLNCGSKKVV